ncbi:MAG: hypothetical protein OXI15_23225, partial [Chromatiales bacterium]|nr:hypothetical protein [Chromatiales bacterium]
MRCAARRPGSHASPRSRRSIEHPARRRSATATPARIAEPGRFASPIRKEASMNSHYRVVIVGGGVVGASVLYHLAKLG